MRTKAPLDRAAQPSQLMANMHRWKFSALAAAAVASVGLYATDASALALGRITVQSALGEPLRAEIELPQITPAEAESLRAQTASPETFRAQGMEYSPAINGLQVQLQRRADGSMVLRLSNSRPVNEPFVDLVLNATWSSGQIVRSYTMLFDPPAMRQAPAAVTAPAQTSAAPASPVPAAQPATAPRTAPSAAVTPAAVPAQPAPSRAAARPAAAADAGSVTVRPGDTAGRLASAHRAPGVSLDQMLVAMMRSNPDAFVGGNMNRLKAGAVLQMPDEAAAQSVAASEARQIVATQSRNFNEFRRKLAAAAPTTEVVASSRTAAGKVQTEVEDKRPATAAPDKLTLSKGALPNQKSADEKLAREKQANANSARVAELSRNISELNKLSAASAPSGNTAPAAAAPAPAAPSVPVAPPAATASAAMAPASAEAAPTPVATASVPAEAASSEAAATPAPAPKPAPAKPAKPVAPPLAPEPEPSFLSGLLDDPMIPMAGGGVLALLLGFGAYRMIQRRRNAAGAGVDSTFAESKLQPDSFFGASGGQRIDTASSEMTTGSSMAYSPSQLDAGGDVDPVAEADVYLAYGRDLQAEEILKEAVRHNPARTSVHVKLGEIYAKRQDRKALESVASDVFQLTQGEGPDWARIAEQGRELDPANPLYQPGGRPGMAAANTGSPAQAMAAPPAPASASALPPNLDLDLDLDSQGDDLTEAPPAPPAAPGGFAAAAAAAGALASAAAAPAPVAAPQPVAPPMPELDLSALDAASPAPAPAPAPVLEPAVEPEPQMAALEFPTGDLELMDSAVAPLTGGQKTAHVEPSMDFDLGDLSLDLGATSPAAAAQTAAPAASAAAPSASEASDPLSTKLALAEEFHAIGDSDGARTLIEEVIAEASGPVKARAQRLLADIG
jgi:pilus assembly protein FimV